MTPDDYKAALASALVEFSSETMFVELVAVEDGEFQGYSYESFIETYYLCKLNMK